MLYFITISTLFFLCKATYTCDSSVTDCSGDGNADSTQICCLDTGASAIRTNTVCQECTTNNRAFPDTCDTCCGSDVPCDDTRECDSGDSGNQGLCRDVSVSTSDPISICDSQVRPCDPLVTDVCVTGLSCETRTTTDSAGTTEYCSVCVCADCDYASLLTDDGCTDANQVCTQDTSGLQLDGLECGTCQDTTPAPITAIPTTPIPTTPNPTASPTLRYSDAVCISPKREANS
eukprot:741108_1